MSDPDGRVGAWFQSLRLTGYVASKFDEGFERG